MHLFYLPFILIVTYALAMRFVGRPRFAGTCSLFVGVAYMTYATCQALFG